MCFSKVASMFSNVAWRRTDEWVGKKHGRARIGRRELRGDANASAQPQQRVLWAVGWDAQLQAPPVAAAAGR
jgi:hypothetical protein